MTDQKLRAALERGAVLIPQRADLMRSAVAYFKAHRGDRFRIFHETEHMSAAAVHALKVEGTILQPLTDALAQAGVATDGTVGALIDAQVLTLNDVHAMACSCGMAGANDVTGHAAELIFMGRLINWDEEPASVTAQMREHGVVDVEA